MRVGRRSPAGYQAKVDAILESVETPKWVNRVHLGSAHDMGVMPDASIDALVTDPPAGISFMGKRWDAQGSSVGFSVELLPVFAECLRVMKPGAHGFVWALPRTAHWTMSALEAAGFEIRDVVTHLFGQGFPKSLNVSKAIDEAAGADRPVTGSERMKRMASPVGNPGSGYALKQPQIVHEHTSAATNDAKRWDGWGTALKPAGEFWVLIRKPIAEKNVAANVLKFGTGAINIDESRIGTDRTVTGRRGHSGDNGVFGSDRRKFERLNQPGRWPANVVLSHNDGCERIGSRVVVGDRRPGGEGERPGGFYAIGSESGDGKPAGTLHGDEEVSVYRCTDGCAVAALDAQSGTTQSGAMDTVRGGIGFQGGAQTPSPAFAAGDAGGASRFFFVAKPGSAEKNAGLDGSAQNTHPTVKPVDLMRYLIRMITPPGGIVLDPFAGSGTTLVAAEDLGFGWVGFERESEYHAIALKRLAKRSLFGGLA